MANARNKREKVADRSIKSDYIGLIMKVGNPEVFNDQTKMNGKSFVKIEIHILRYSPINNKPEFVIKSEPSSCLNDVRSYSIKSLKARICRDIRKRKQVDRIMWTQTNEITVVN